MYIQQGDVLLKQCEKPSGIKIDKTDLLWKGQNHHHRLRGKFRIAKDAKGDVFVHSKGAELFHEEHKTLSVHPGFYRLGIVQEYDHLLEESRAVID
jgi:hypothetical protein